jgi:hypothetical protein
MILERPRPVTWIALYVEYSPYWYCILRGSGAPNGSNLPMMNNHVGKLLSFF